MPFRQSPHDSVVQTRCQRQIIQTQFSVIQFPYTESHHSLFFALGACIDVPEEITRSHFVMSPLVCSETSSYMPRKHRFIKNVKHVIFVDSNLR